MTERLQNIINGINDGSIKFVFEYNLTMEDLFTKDNDGIYFLEYLLRKIIMIPLELKKKLKTNALAAYLYCKNGSSLFGFNLSEKDLFTEFDGKKITITTGSKSESNYTPYYGMTKVGVEVTDSTNTLYNSKITSIAPNDFENITSLRIDILEENISEIQQIIDTVNKGEKLKGTQYTNGNLNREI